MMSYASFFLSIFSYQFPSAYLPSFTSPLRDPFAAIWPNFYPLLHNQLFTYTSCTFYCETLEGRNYVSFILASSENNVVPTSEEVLVSASGMMASRMEGVSFWHTVLSLI